MVIHKWNADINKLIEQINKYKSVNVTIHIHHFHIYLFMF